MPQQETPQKCAPKSTDRTGGRTAAASPSVIQNLIRGYQSTQMIYVAAKLRIADHLERGALSVSKLAELTGGHEASLYRLLRALAGLGIFAEEAGRRFRLTPAAQPLRSGAAGSVRVQAEVAGEDWVWRSWGALLHSVRTGETAFDHVYGQGTFDWFARHPEAAQLFDKYQAENTARATEQIVGAYDFAQIKTVVDVGGGTGTLLSAILRHHPNLQGILFDLEHVVARARSSVDSNLALRCQFASGSVFEQVPHGGDLYILKSVVHDWDDARVRTILTICRRAMTGNEKLLLIERIVCEPNEPCEAKTTDLMMLVRTGGRERTVEEYQDLLAATGFQFTGLFPTDGPYTVLEAVPCE